jgi:hypothetical protein
MNQDENKDWRKWQNEIAPKIREYVGYAIERNLDKMVRAMVKAEELERGAELPITLKAVLGPGKLFSVTSVSWDFKMREVDKDFWELDLDTNSPPLPGLEDCINPTTQTIPEWAVKCIELQKNILKLLSRVEGMSSAVMVDERRLEIIDRNGNNIKSVPDAMEALEIIDKDSDKLAVVQTRYGLLALLPESLKVMSDFSLVVDVALANGQGWYERNAGCIDCWPNFLEKVEEPEENAELQDGAGGLDAAKGE